MDTQEVLVIAEEAQRLEQRIRAVSTERRELQAQCPHPIDQIRHDDNCTICIRCDTTLWSRPKVITEPHQWLGGGLVSRFAELRAQLLQAQEKNLEAQKRNQAQCSHPEEEAKESPDNSWCGICLKDWNEIDDERAKPAQVGPIISHG